MPAPPNESEPLRIARIDGRDGQRYAVLTLISPANGQEAAAELIRRMLKTPNDQQLSWLLRNRFYEQVPMSGVSLEHPPQRPIGDLLVDLYAGAVFRIVHERAIATGLTIDTRAFAARLH